MKKVIYTVITSDDYTLKEPIVINSNWELICFTNQKKLTSKNWRIIQIDNQRLTNQKLSRKIKLLSHSYLNFADLSIYIDSRFTINRNLDMFVDKYLQNKYLAIMLHNRRNCLFDEADYLIKLNIASKSRLTKQINKYISEGMPANFGLFAPGIMIRKHHNVVLDEFMELWWKEVYKWTEVKDGVRFSRTDYVVLIRQSNTSPLIRVQVEADKKKIGLELLERFKKLVLEIKKDYR